MNSWKALLVAGLFVGVFNSSQPAFALTVFSTRTAFDLAYPGAAIENWDSYASGTVITNGSTLNGITYQTNVIGNNSLVTSDFYTTTGDNGLGATDVGFFRSSDTITFSFAQPLSAFGIDINTYATTQGEYTATLDNGHVINSFFDVFPGLDTGKFIGFADDTAFNSVTITDAGATYAYTLDTLRYVEGNSVVPEPSTIALMMIALLTAAGWTLRRKLAVVRKV